eukprot:scaffold1318_cov388-Prasinococcus_capsulatus_cf.AAC.22
MAPRRNTTTEPGVTITCQHLAVRECDVRFEWRDDGAIKLLAVQNYALGAREHHKHLALRKIAELCWLDAPHHDVSPARACSLELLEWRPRCQRYSLLVPSQPGSIDAAACAGSTWPLSPPNLRRDHSLYLPQPTLPSVRCTACSPVRPESSRGASMPAASHPHTLHLLPACPPLQGDVRTDERRANASGTHTTHCLQSVLPDNQKTLGVTTCCCSSPVASPPSSPPALCRWRRHLGHFSPPTRSICCSPTSSSGASSGMQYLYTVSATQMWPSVLRHRIAQLKVVHHQERRLRVRHALAVADDLLRAVRNAEGRLAQHEERRGARRVRKTRTAIVDDTVRLDVRGAHLVHAARVTGRGVGEHVQRHLVRQAGPLQLADQRGRVA